VKTAKTRQTLTRKHATKIGKKTHYENFKKINNKRKPAHQKSQHPRMVYCINKQNKRSNINGK